MRHPKGLYTLFFTEMWERFSYYGMRALLMLYMVQELGFGVDHAAAIYGTYTSLVYLAPAFGGIVADTVLGQRRAVLLGGVVMALGHMLMAMPGLPAFFVALLFLVIGSGLFKPNASVLLGMLYGPNDTRRDAGFSLFYIGINLGSFLAPFVCGTLGQKMGWHYGFGSAAIGMLVALVIFHRGQKSLGDLGMQPRVTGRIGGTKLTLSRQDIKRLTLVFVLALFGNVAFWAAFEQAGSSLALFAERDTDLQLTRHWRVPSSWLQAVNPLFIAILAPVFTWMWTALGRRKKEPSVPHKFIVGLVLVALGFATLMVGGRQVDRGLKASMGWLILAYFFNTCGELCVSPVGLAEVTRLAPKGLASAVMGLWFASMAAAMLLGGSLAGEYGHLSKEMFFALPALTALLGALMLFAIARPLTRLSASTASIFFIIILNSSACGPAFITNSTSKQTSSQSSSEAAVKTANSVLLQDLGGRRLTAPKAVLVTYNNDPQAQSLQTFLTSFAASGAFAAMTHEYGIGPLTVSPGIARTLNWGSHATGGKIADGEDATIEAEIIASLDVTQVWGAADTNTVYIVALPYDTAPSLNANSASGCDPNLLGWHTALTLPSSQTVVSYIVLSQCAALPGYAQAASNSIVLSHLLVDTVLNPTLTSYGALNASHAFWQWPSTEPEASALCTAAMYGNPNWVVTPLGMTTPVQRTWSNQAASDGNAPCVPSPLGEPFLRAVADVNQVVGVIIPGAQPSLLTQSLGLSLAAGQAKQMNVHLAGNALASGLWRVDVSEVGSTDLAMSLNPNIGSNGDILRLTVSKAAAPGSKQHLVRLTATHETYSFCEYLLVSALTPSE